MVAQVVELVITDLVAHVINVSFNNFACCVANMLSCGRMI